MRGLFFASLLCIVLYMHSADAQWVKWIMVKGKTCEDRCKFIGKRCDPVAEFNNCKCFPQEIVDNWLQYQSLPLDPNEVCTYLMSLSNLKTPKCCSFYEKLNEFNKELD